MTLVEMTPEIKSLYTALDFAETQDDPEVTEIKRQALFDTLEAMGVTEKQEAYVAVITSLDQEIADLEKEIQRVTEFYTKQIKSKQRSAEWLELNLVNSMDAMQEKKLTIGTHTVTRRDYERVEIDSALSAADFADEYCKIETKTTRSVDKTAIKQAIKDGKTIKGASIVINRKVQIK